MRICLQKCKMPKYDETLSLFCWKSVWSTSDISLTNGGRSRDVRQHICASKLNHHWSDNGLLPDRHQAVIWTNAGILLIGPLGRSFGWIVIKNHIFPFKKMLLKMSSGKWRPFCLGLNVLKNCDDTWYGRSWSPLVHVIACLLWSPFLRITDLLGIPCMRYMLLISRQHNSR